MARTSKSTIKFQKKNLKQTIERRKKNAKLKQQINRRKDRRQHSGSSTKNAPSTTSDSATQGESKESAPVTDNVDVYFCNYMLNSEDVLDLENDEEQDVDGLDAFEAVEDEESREKDMELDLAREEEIESESEDEEEEMDEDESDDGNDDNDDNDDDMDGEEEEEGQVVTKEMLNTWTLAASKKSPEAFKQLLLAFRSIAHDESISPKYRVTNSKVYTKLAVATVTAAYPIFSQHLLVNKKVRHPAKTRFWPKLGRVVRLFLNNVVRFVRDLDQDDLLVEILRQTEPCAMYFGCFPTLAKEYLKVLLDRWADFSLEADTRLVCYKAIRSLVVDAVDVDTKQNFLGDGLKAVYLVFAKRAATKLDAHTQAPLQQMMDEAADLYTVDPKLSHQHGHIYIHQLTDRLKLARKSGDVSGFKTVYTWQYISCLDFWANIVAVTCNPEVGVDSPMQALLAPIVDLSLHTLRLNPTAQFLPLRIHILRSLIALIDSTGFYIPLAPFLFEMLGNDIFQIKPTQDIDDAFEYEYYLKTPKEYIQTKVYQNAVYRVVYDSIVDYYACFGLSIAYPELAIPAIAKLKDQREKVTGSRFVKSLKQLIEKLETHKNYIEQKRAPIEYTPSKLDEVSAFLRNTSFEQTPLGGFLKKRADQNQA